MKKVLVVDDEETIREAVSEFLKNEGDYEIFQAEDGYKALKIFGENPIDLVFMDVKMPGIDGIEVFRQMKHTNPNIKVVIMTGLPDEQTFDRAVAISDDVAEGFIAKPFKPADLRKCLKNVLAGDCHASFQLTPNQLDSLGKCVTKAIGTVSTALSQIVQKDAKVVLQGVNVVPLAQISKPQEEPGKLSVGLVSKFSGSISGTLLLIFSWEGGLALLDLIKKIPVGTTKTFDEQGQANLKSLGTILTGTYLKVLSEELKLSIQPGFPELTFEHRNAVIKSVAKELSPRWETEGEYFFTIETELSIIEPLIHCWVSLIPTTDSLKSILRVLGTLK
jgi:CheY-like chemotaxis protein